MSKQMPGLLFSSCAALSTAETVGENIFSFKAISPGDGLDLEITIK